MFQEKETAPRRASVTLDRTEGPEAIRASLERREVGAGGGGERRFWRSPHSQSMKSLISPVKEFGFCPVVPGEPLKSFVVCLLLLFFCIYSTLFIQKNTQLSGPMQFKSVSFRGQLCFDHL